MSLAEVKASSFSRSPRSQNSLVIPFRYFFFFNSCDKIAVMIELRIGEKSLGLTFSKVSDYCPSATLLLNLFWGSTSCIWECTMKSVSWLSGSQTAMQDLRRGRGGCPTEDYNVRDIHWIGFLYTRCHFQNVPSAPNSVTDKGFKSLRDGH